MSDGVHQVTIHGGVRFAGDDPNSVNLQLEELAADPTDAKTSRIWLNTAEEVVKIVVGNNPDGTPKVVGFINTEDFAVVMQMLGNKADVATTLAGYGITDGLTADDP